MLWVWSSYSFFFAYPYPCLCWYFLCLFGSGEGSFWSSLFSFLNPAFSALKEQLHKIILINKASSTMKTYLAAFCCWSQCTSSLDLCIFPAQPVHGALYLLHLAQSLSSSSSVVQVSAAICLVACQSGYSQPCWPCSDHQTCSALQHIWCQPIKCCTPLSPIRLP